MFRKKTHLRAVKILELDKQCFYKMQACTAFIVQLAVCCYVSAYFTNDGSDFSEKQII